MKQNRVIIILIVTAILTLLVAGSFVPLTPNNSKGPLTVSFVGLTNDATGAKVALFAASNGTHRLFIRGLSEIEMRGSVSNQLVVTQITNVDYLRPGKSVSFAVRCAADGVPWRLKFYYMDQFTRLESLKFGLGRSLQRHGCKISGIPRHDTREITTEWISD